MPFSVKKINQGYLSSYTKFNCEKFYWRRCRVKCQKIPKLKKCMSIFWKPFCNACVNIIATKFVHHCRLGLSNWVVFNTGRVAKNKILCYLPLFGTKRKTCISRLFGVSMSCVQDFLSRTYHCVGRTQSVYSWVEGLRNICTALQWRHNGRDGVSNHRLFRHRSKKTSKLRVTGLCVGNSPVTGEFPAQRVSESENVSTWWCHHDYVWIYMTQYIPMVMRPVHALLFVVAIPCWSVLLISSWILDTRAIFSPIFVPEPAQ